MVMKDNEKLGRDVDPDQPWAPGAIPVLPENDVALVHTRVYPTLLDFGGSKHSFVAASVVARMGARFARIVRVERLELGGSGVGSAIHGMADSQASFLATVQFSFQTNPNPQPPH